MQTVKGYQAMNENDLEKQRLEEEERKRRERAVEVLEQSLEKLKKSKRTSYNDQRVDRDQDYYD